ncbi:Uncharacterized protein HZ326_15961 [Fusarium oxysporum f. sp. albedinis]|nr:Uncharacterized protein HZ326_15961 [Fusarium oxysporum f. sp. albedinis]
MRRLCGEVHITHCGTVILFKSCERNCLFVVTILWELQRVDTTGHVVLVNMNQYVCAVPSALTLFFFNLRSLRCLYVLVLSKVSSSLIRDLFLCYDETV